MCSALYRGRKSLGSYRRKNEGGKSGQNAGRLRFVRAVFGGVSFKFHWRLTVSSLAHDLYCHDHFCPHLTLNLFVVNNKVIGSQSVTGPNQESTRNCG